MFRPKLKASLSLTLLMILSACAGKQIKEDLSITPAEGKDVTGIIRGCGNQPIVGFTYCRLTEGDIATQQVEFFAPPAECLIKEACVFIHVYDQSGNLAWGGSIPKGKTYVSVSWKDLIHADAFQVGMRGFWSFTTHVHWSDSDGVDRVSVTKGEIILRVTKKGYQALNQVRDDSAFAWNWHEFGYEFKSSTSLRAYVLEIKE